MTWHDMIASLDQSFCEVVLLIVYLFITRITISQSLEGGRSYSWADPVNFDKGDLLLVAPWFGLSSFSALMYPSTQVDKCWYGDWIYIGLVAGGGTQQSLFYWKIYDPQTWRYSDLTLTLSSLLSYLLTTSQATLQSQLSHYHGYSREKEGHQQWLFVPNLNSLVHISQYK